MNNFDDLPSPERIQRQAATAQEQRSQFVRESSRLFSEMATKLAGLEPSTFFEVTPEQHKHHWLFGAKTIPAVTKRAWELGLCEPLSDEPFMTYLLPDGRVYPNVESGIRALLAKESYLWQKLGDIVDPALVAQARGLVVEGLKQRYINRWCLGR